MSHGPAVVAFAACLAGIAAAQDAPPAEPSSGAAGQDIVLELGGGTMVRPAYEGADAYLLTPDTMVLLHYLRLPVLGGFGGGPKAGFSCRALLRLRAIAGGGGGGLPDLDGLGAVSQAYELGATNPSELCRETRAWPETLAVSSIASLARAVLPYALIKPDAGLPAPEARAKIRPRGERRRCCEARASRGMQTGACVASRPP